MAIGTIKQTSPPARGRGLKHHTKSNETVCKFVAPRAGAWIETYGYFRTVSSSGRPPRGGVDWNTFMVNGVPVAICRPPRGGVDWNTKYIYPRIMPTESPPRAGAWIETAW